MTDAPAPDSADHPYGPPFGQPVAGNSGQAPPPTQPPVNPAATPTAGQPYNPAMSPPQSNYIPPTPAQHPLSASDERLWAMLSFLLSIIAGFLAPLVIYLVFRDRSQFVRVASREALNLQITAIIVGLSALVGMGAIGLVAAFAFPPAGAVILIGWFLIAIGYSIAVLIFEIIGAMKANSGEAYRVPYILRLVKN